jgi:hypothetical protein
MVNLDLHMQFLKEYLCFVLVFLFLHTSAIAQAEVYVNTKTDISSKQKDYLDNKVAQSNMQCFRDADCGLSESCRSKPGGGTFCKRREDYMVCSSDSDCNKGESCRSRSGGGTFCKTIESENECPSDQHCPNNQYCQNKSGNGTSCRTENPSSKKQKSTSVELVNLNKLTDAVMNGWRSDFQYQMSQLLSSTECTNFVNLKNLTDSVMNGWRADFQKQMSILVECSGCTSKVNIKKLADSVMNGWRADFQQEMSALLICTSK